MIYNRLTTRLLYFGLLFFFSFQLSAQGDANKGKALFKANCATCHAKNMKSKLTGPALGGTEERWAEYPRQDLYDWVRNAPKMIEDGHPRAKELWAEYKPTAMNLFPNLSDQDIDDMLLYVNNMYVSGCANPPCATAVVEDTGATNTSDSGMSGWLFGLLLGVLALLALVLTRIVSNLNYMAKVKEGQTDVQRSTMMDVLTSRGVVSFAIFALVVLGGYTTVNNAIALGRQQGYQPKQPINFSHKIHAGTHKIDCQYCHDSARKSKHASIPAANTCVNCHSAIKYGSNEGHDELAKIYASAGFDPKSGQYIDDYENMNLAQKKKLFTDWMVESTIENDERYSAKTDAVVDLVDSQWKNIETALNMKEDGSGKLEWVKIHNLPDHVYFNHSQHVVAGKVECQTCHGQVEEMEVLEQYAPLSMGWCVNCHRETKVDFEGNEYYEVWDQYHKDKKENVTVEDIGGLECQKCHY